MTANDLSVERDEAFLWLNDHIGELLVADLRVSYSNRSSSVSLLRRQPGPLGYGRGDGAGVDWSVPDWRGHFRPDRLLAALSFVIRRVPPETRDQLRGYRMVIYAKGATDLTVRNT
jgi:hypothetical protein